MAEEKTEQKKKLPTAEKRVLQNEKRRLENRHYKSQVRTAIRRFQDAIAKSDQAAVNEALNCVYSLMDKCVKKGIYKINKASRSKARLAAKAAAIS